jgi:hypothetical protein
MARSCHDKLINCLVGHNSPKSYRKVRPHQQLLSAVADVVTGFVRRLIYNFIQENAQFPRVYFSHAQSDLFRADFFLSTLVRMIGPQSILARRQGSVWTQKDGCLQMAQTGVLRVQSKWRLSPNHDVLLQARWPRRVPRYLLLIPLLSLSSLSSKSPRYSFSPNPTMLLTDTVYLSLLFLFRNLPLLCAA